MRTKNTYSSTIKATIYFYLQKGLCIFDLTKQIDMTENIFATRSAELVISRPDDFNNPKGTRCLNLARKIVAKTATDAEVKSFNNMRDFIGLSLM